MIIRRFPSSHNLRENGDRKYAFKNHNNNSPTKMPNNNSPNKNLLVALNNKLSKQSITHESSCTSFILNNEDSIRFFILAALIILYMTVGAAVFFALEEPHETERLKSFQTSLSLSIEDIKASIEGRNITMVQIEELLYLWGNASEDGFVSSNRKWDYAGSFHFVYTVVSTTGFGATAPNTSGGKIFLIFYGLLGCSSGILFFNLFLERIITVITWIMKVLNKRQDEHLQLKAHSEERSNDDDDVLDDWKPSVYWVIFYLTVFSATFGG
ncbi:Potassium channel subfamily K member 13 [Armadillidium nasatum]|uniref:Potassium channel subfamily K member 13 n=1 Tax=Armadillidium nasatum TaxID=96803 RepID=A0A5N5SPL4_9CRUS|nr:Potassium channel subfamily K member 13 [Armadillidium nasatum]